MSYPLVSIITPSLNQSPYIRQTIESVLSQDYPHIEYIVVDGGSTDGTVKILKEYQSIHWMSEKDKGQADAINKGLKIATGQIVGYINSDDYYLPRAISGVVRYFEMHKETQWVSGDYRIIDDRGKEIHSFIRWYKYMLRTLKVPLEMANSIAQPSTFWRRSLMNRAGMFNPKLTYTFDYDYWLRLQKIAPPCITNERFSAFRIHASSKGGALYKRQFEEELEVLRHYTDNTLMVELHKAHNAVIVGVYRLIK